MPPTTFIAPGEQPAQLNTYALWLVQRFSFEATTIVLQYSLSSLLFGALTILVIASITLLIGQGSLRRTRILLLSILTLYASTVVYMSAILWNWITVQRIVREANDGLYSDSYNGHDSYSKLQAAAYSQSWMITVPLGVNILIGDSIVWWRAAVIWQNRAVNWVGPILVLTTLALGTIGSIVSPSATPDQVFFWWGTDGFTSAAVILSFVTNTSATILIAIKAWMHRLSLQRYFHAKTRVLKALALLVESGTIYCALLILVLIALMDPASLKNTIEHHTIGYYFVYGSLTPVVAMYPTIIIVLVAVNRSPLEHGILVEKSMDSQGPMSATTTVAFAHDVSTMRTPGAVEEGKVAEMDEATLRGRSFDFNTLQSKSRPSLDNVLDISM